MQSEAQVYLVQKPCNATGLNYKNFLIQCDVETVFFLILTLYVHGTTAEVRMTCCVDTSNCMDSALARATISNQKRNLLCDKSNYVDLCYENYPTPTVFAKIFHQMPHLRFVRIEKYANEIHVAAFGDLQGNCCYSKFDHEN